MTDRRSPPRGMTLLDLAALVAGFAAAFALSMRGSQIGPMPYGVAIPAWVILGLLAAWLILLAEVATSAAIVARRFRYGGLPRPADWLALLLAAILLVRAIPNVDEAVNLVYRLRGDSNADFSLLRWFWAGAASLLVVAILAALILGRRRVPAGLKTILLLLAALALLWGPLPVWKQEIPWLIAHPSPPLPGSRQWPFRIVLEVRQAIGRLPTSLLFGVPAVAAILDFRRSDRPAWTWTEWVGATSASLFAALVLVAAILSALQAHAIAVGIGWAVQMVATVLLSWAIVRGLGPAWSRRIVGGYDRVEAR